MDRECGLAEFSIFTSALLAGSVSSISSKVLLGMQSTGLSGEIEAFSYPLFQSFAMFVGMLAGILVHWLVICFKIPFPGYTHTIESTVKELQQKQQQNQRQKEDEESQRCRLCAGMFSNLNDADFADDSLHAYSLDEQHRQLQSMAVDAEPTPMWIYFFLIVPSIFDLVATTLCMYGLKYMNVSVFQMLRGE